MDVSTELSTLLIDMLNKDKRLENNGKDNANDKITIKIIITATTVMVVVEVGGGIRV